MNAMNAMSAAGPTSACGTTADSSPANSPGRASASATSGDTSGA
ncbi:putative lipoprotein [Burkholderia pseudomallei MSHR5613]|nr:putative lipoprotein [Burkholderia pseudomallei MSHR5608]KGS38775.1 putative lipoprotein [Burkholderia pseudomallei MSHR5613]